MMSVKSFLRAYGKHMFVIESFLMISCFLSFTLLVLFGNFSLYTNAVIVFLLPTVLHFAVCARVCRAEILPRESLLLESVHRLFYKVLLMLSIPAILLLFLIVIYLPKGYWQNPLFHVLEDYAAISVGPVMVFYFYPIGLMNKRKRFRLCLRSALTGLKLISTEKDDDKRRGLIGKHIKWVRNGLQSYGRVLYKKESVQIELVNIDEYYQSLCCTALMGKRRELDLMSGQVRRVLDCVPRLPPKQHDDMRQLLVSLRNIRNFETRREYRLSELRDMTRILSRSDRVRNELSSPYVVVVVSLVPIVLQAMSMLKLI